MKLSTTFAVISVAMLSAAATADTYYASYGWEDGGTIVGSYGNLGGAFNVANPQGDGNSLMIQEDPVGGTPQAFVCWINGLTEGDYVTASFMGYGNNDTGDSSVRLWSHYTATGGDVDSYHGSAGGDGTYSEDTWTYMSNQWTFNSDGGNHGGLVIEARIYTTGSDNGYAYVDDLFVEVVDADGSGGIEIILPGAVPAPGALALLGFAGLAGSRRRR